ncbi:MAG: hypothetical protein V2A76_00955 [Planctomycetota bacterium]
MLQLVAAANHRVKVFEWSVAFKGVSSTASPILVQLIRQTTAGTMSAATPVKLNSGDDESLQTTAQKTATAEPTGSEVIDSIEVHPQAGYTWQAPFGAELCVKGGERLGLVVTAAADVNCNCKFFFEE